MFYLTTHSTHFIYGYMASDIIMVKDHSDSERVNPLPPYIHHPTDRIATTTVFVTPVVEHWLERELAQWVHHEESTRRPIAPRANILTTELHLTPNHSEGNSVSTPRLISLILVRFRRKSRITTS